MTVAAVTPVPVVEQAGWTGDSDTADYITFVLNLPDLSINLSVLGLVVVLDG